MLAAWTFRHCDQRAIDTVIDTVNHMSEQKKRQPPENRCTGRSKHKVRTWLNENRPTWQEDTRPSSPERKALWAEAPYEVVRCGNPAIAGGEVCADHGGAAKQVAAKAERNVQAAAAERALGKFGIVDEETLRRTRVDPIFELQMQAARARFTVMWLEQLVADLDTITVKTQFGDQPHVLIDMLTKARWALNKLLVEMGKLGIAERQVQLEEAQLTLMLGLFRAAFTDPELALTPAQQAVVPNVVRRALPALSAEN